MPTEPTLMSVLEQVKAGKLMFPVSRQPLLLDEESACLITPDKRYRYPLLKGCVPVLLANPEAFGIDLHTETAPTAPAHPAPQPMRAQFGGITGPIKRRVQAGHDFRPQAAIDAAARLLDEQPEGAFCLSVGGGPRRNHPKLVNLNIAPFPNVEIVADAHALPYMDNSVDTIFCEAVLEHLQNPWKAVEEMYRVLRPGAKAFVATPFLQAYHGYSHHYQNFTLTGHTNLFTSQGFKVLESGSCVGPTFALVTLMGEYLAQYYPSRFWIKVWNLIGLCLIPRDARLNLKPNAHILASTTYLVAKKRTQM